MDMTYISNKVSRSLTSFDVNNKPFLLRQSRKCNLNYKPISSTLAPCYIVNLLRWPIYNIVSVDNSHHFVTTSPPKQYHSLKQTPHTSLQSHKRFPLHTCCIEQCQEPTPQKSLHLSRQFHHTVKHSILTMDCSIPRL